MAIRRRDRSARLLGYARHMRREPTEAEIKLWSILRGNQLGGFHFRRQVPIGGCIVDFFCAKANVGVEAKRYDESRDAALAAMGVRMLRFSDVDILQSLDAVGEAILQRISSPAANADNGIHMITPPPLPSPGVPGEGEREAPSRDDIIWDLLSSDLAQEVKAEFNGQLAVGLDVAGATQHVFAQFRAALVDPHNGPVVVLCLAAMQLKEDQLHPVVREAALDLIDSGEAAAAFPAESGERRSGQREFLDQFAAALKAASVVEG